MPMRESARGHASSRRLPRSQTSRFSLFPPDPSPRLCQYCRPHPFFLHPEAIQDRLFSVFRFCGRRSFLANAKASPSCPDRTVCSARISRSINLLRRDQFSESCRLRPCFFTILSEARSRHCRFSIIFSPSLSAIFCDAQIALVITHFCRKGTKLSSVRLSFETYLILALNAVPLMTPILMRRKAQSRQGLALSVPPIAMKFLTLSYLEPRLIPLPHVWTLSKGLTYKWLSASPFGTSTRLTNMALNTLNSLTPKGHNPSIFHMSYPCARGFGLARSWRRSRSLHA